MSKALATVCVVCTLVMCACAAPKKSQKTLNAVTVTTADNTTTTTTVAPVPSTPDTAAPVISTAPPSTTLPEPEPVTEPPATPADHTTLGLDPDGNPWPSPADADWAIWEAMARCETGGNWAMHGSRYSGGVGFYNGTWSSYGGDILGISNAGDATETQQIWVARRVRDRHGYSAWGCAGAIGVG